MTQAARRCRRAVSCAALLVLALSFGAIVATAAPALADVATQPTEQQIPGAGENLETLVRRLIGTAAPQVAPGTQQRVAEAVADIAEGASAGDGRLQRALDLLQADRVAEAVAPLHAFADDKATHRTGDGKDAATAYRTLGAIAGLVDPGQALNAYVAAIGLDADDIDSLFAAGWIERDRGPPADAERHLGRVVALARGDDQASYAFWARVGLGELQTRRGDLEAATALYRDAEAIAGRADPGNAAWLHALAVGHYDIAGIQQARGDLAAALAGYQASQDSFARVAAAEPGDGDAQRDLSVAQE